jgi:RHS repeat-associated protein
VIDARGNPTVTTKDVWGRTTLITPPTGPTVAYTYDLFGRLLTAIRGGVTSAIKYDQAGRKIAMDDPDLGYIGTTSDDDWAWRYGYDAIGNLTAQTGPRGYPAQDCTVTISYDLLNRPTNKGSTGNCDEGQGQLNIIYTYDQGTNGSNQTQKGFRTGMTDFSGSSTWTYDSRGSVLSEIKTITGTLYSTYWTYNQAGLPVNMVYPDGETITYGYNALMQLKTMSSMQGTYVTDISYDSASRITGRSLGSGVTQAFTYYNWIDKATVDGQLVGQGGRLHFLTAGTLQNYTYTYDASGNIRTIFSNADGALGSADDQTQSFTYDILDRITSAGTSGDPNTGGYSETYDYDAATGNLAHKAGQFMYYYPTERPHAPTVDSEYSYTYVAGGDMRYRVKGQDKRITFYYDAEEHLVHAVSEQGPQMDAYFVYDGDGRRVQSTINGTTTTFVGGYYEKTGSAVTKYYYAGGSRIAMRAGGTLYYLLADHLGSTNITTNASGGKVAELRYKAWGEVRFSSGATPTRYTYTGQYDHTSDFGLMYYNARWYSPTLSHFSQPDTVVPGGVQGLDRYAFVNNNPIRYTDPSGHYVCPDDGCLRPTAESVLARFGVRLDTIAGGAWSTAEKLAVLKGVVDVGKRFAELLGGTAAGAFMQVYGHSFRFTRSNETPGNAGYANDYNHITLYNVANSPNYFEDHPRLIVHELGHALNLATGRAAEDSIAAGLLRDSDGVFTDETGRFYGFSGGWDDWQFGWDNTQSEVFADMFVGWVYNSWDPRHRQNLGTLRQTHMSTNMLGWITGP